MATVKLEATSGGSLDKLEGELRDVERQLGKLQSVVAKLSGKPLDLPTDPAEADIKRLVSQLAKLENAFRRAEATADFNRVRNGIERTTESARRLANANATLAARGKELIDFSRRLPPELRKSSVAMDRLERQTEEAANAFRRFRANAAAARGGLSSLLSSVNGLRAGLAAVVAGLGIQQFLRLGRQLVQLSSEAIAVKREFDRLEPTLRGLLGSTDLAGESIDFLQKTSEELKFATSALIKPYISLTAAVRETGLSLEENDRVFKAVVESGRAFGLSADQINRALTAVSQTAGKTVFCVDTDTEIFTGRGWMSVTELDRADSVMQMATDGRHVWGHLREIYRYPDVRAEVEMIVGGQSVFMTTEHRVLDVSGEIHRAGSLRRATLPTPGGSVRAAFSRQQGPAGVWCPSTETGTWLARKGAVEFFTGNSMEELRQQLGEAIPNAIAGLARGLNVTVAEAIERVSDGALTAAEGLPALARGLEELNSAAARNQLDTLGAQLDNIGRLTEIAQKQFADGLAPGLRDALDATEEFLSGSSGLATFFGEVLGDGITQAVTNFSQLKEGLIAFSEELENSSLGLVSVRDQIEGIARLLPVGGDALRAFGDRLEGLPQRGEDAFKKLESEAKKLAGAVGETAREVEAHYREAFEAAVKDFDLSARDIAELSRGLASDIAAAAEEGEKQRQALLKTRVLAEKASAEERLQVERLVAGKLLEIHEERVAKEEEILTASVEASERLAAQRVETEREAGAEIAASLDVVVEAARAAGAGRAAADAQTASKIEQIERELQEKIQQLRDEAAERLLKPKVDREKIARELLEKIVKAEREAGAKIRAEQKRIADEAEKAAERRAKAEEKVQKALERSIESYRRIVAAIREAAEGASSEGGEAEGGGFSRVADQIEEARSALGDFIIDLETLNQQSGITDAADVLTAGLSRMNAILGTSATSLDNFFAQGEQVGVVAKQSAGVLRDQLVAALGDAASAAEGLSGTVRSTVEEILRRYLDLAAGGDVTRDDLQGLADELSAAFGGVGQAVGDDLEEIRQELDSLGDAQDAAAESAEDAGQRMEDAPKGAALVVDELAGSVEQVGDQWEQVGEGVERAGQRIERSAAGLVTVTDKLEETGEAGLKAKEGLDATAEGAEAAATPLQQVADAVNAFPPEIVPEGQPEQLRQLGTAAGEAAPLILPLAAPIAQIAEKLILLSESLPTIAAQIPAISATLPELQASLSALLQTITENPTDLEGTAANLGAIDTALASVSQSTATLKTILPDLQAAIDPLFEAAKAAAADDRLGKIAEALDEMARAAPQIPEPIKRLAESLKAITAGRDETVEAINSIRNALENLSAAELEKRLGLLVDVLAKAQEQTGELAADAAKIRSELESIEANIPKVVFQLVFLAEELTGKVLPAVAEVRDGLEGLNQQLGAIPAAAGKAAESLRAIEESIPAINSTTEAVDRLAASLLAAFENARQLNQELAQVQIP